MAKDEKPVLVLGGGINGAAVARELVLRAVPVCLVDRADIAGGATAYSSRLIHGGLRYLEYADIALVRESLAERARLLRLAPQFVQPLRFFIPVAERTSGLWLSAAKFVRSRWAARLRPKPRGQWLVRTGLMAYDLLARDRLLPRHAVHRVGEPGTPPVSAERYRWVCSYSDAQMRYPERFVVALLRDAQQIAVQRGVAFQVFTYHCASWDGDAIRLESTRPDAKGLANAARLDPGPAAIVNATGCWVDQTLQRLGVASERLMGGTKGSHFLTLHAGLRAALDRGGVYAEASDGRPVFLLPLGPYCLIGTTDLPLEQDPSEVVAAPFELEYLRAAVRDVFPHVDLQDSDIAFHYSGVRPLPASRAANPASVTRGHVVHEHAGTPVPLISLIGGKLTTCRQLAEEAATAIERRLGRPAAGDSRNRPIPGGDNYPLGDQERQDRHEQIAFRTGASSEQVAAVWQLCGSLAESLLAPATPLTAGTPPDADLANVPGTLLPVRFVRRVVGQEWCQSLSDLVERRLMLLYEPELTRESLDAVAECLVEQGILDPGEQGSAVAECVHRLATRYGRDLVPRSR